VHMSVIDPQQSAIHFPGPCRWSWKEFRIVISYPDYFLSSEEEYVSRGSCLFPSLKYDCLFAVVALRYFQSWSDGCGHRAHLSKPEDHRTRHGRVVMSCMSSLRLKWLKILGGLRPLVALLRLRYFVTGYDSCDKTLRVSLDSFKKLPARHDRYPAGTLTYDNSVPILELHKLSKLRYETQHNGTAQCQPETIPQHYRHILANFLRLIIKVEIQMLQSRMIRKPRAHLSTRK
jgi:hypothetical protein